MKNYRTLFVQNNLGLKTNFNKVDRNKVLIFFFFFVYKSQN